MLIKTNFEIKKKVTMVSNFCCSDELVINDNQKLLFSSFIPDLVYYIDLQKRYRAEQIFWKYPQVLTTIIRRTKIHSSFR